MKVTTVEEFYGKPYIVEREATDISFVENSILFSVDNIRTYCSKSRLNEDSGVITMNYSLFDIYIVAEIYREAIEKLGRACVRSPYKIVQDYGKHLLAYTGPPMRFKYMHRDYMQNTDPSYNPEDQFYIGRLLFLKKILPKYVEKFIDLLAI